MTRSYIKNDPGKTIGIRETNKDGRRSRTYEPDNSSIGQLFDNGKSKHK